MPPLGAILFVTIPALAILGMVLFPQVVGTILAMFFAGCAGYFIWDGIRRGL